MKIFVTGIAGLLGSHIADELIARGHTVVGCDNLIGGYLDNVPKEAEFHQVDCQYLSTMAKLMKGCDVVVHTACTAYEGLSVFSPHLVTSNTYGISVTVMTAAIQAGVRRFVYLSSMARYGEQATTPFREDMIPRPRDPYGVAKLAGEETLKILAKVHNLEYVIAVPHNIIGPRQKYDDPYRNVASIMINLMLQGRQPIIYGDGLQKRCFSFISDVVGPLVKMVEENDVLGRIINVGPDEGEVTMLELAQRIAKLLDFKLDPIYFPDRPQEVKHATCSADKARRLLGYDPQTSLDEGLKEMIKWIRKRGVKPFRYHLDLEIINGRTPKTWKDKVF